MREIAAEWVGVGVETLAAEASYNLPEWGIVDGAEYRELHRFAVTQRFGAYDRLRLF